MITDQRLSEHTTISTARGSSSRSYSCMVQTVLHTRYTMCVTISTQNQVCSSFLVMSRPVLDRI